MFAKECAIPQCTHDEGEDETAHALSDLHRDVTAELDERGEEALQLAQLSSAARRGQLLWAGRTGRGWRRHRW